MWLIVLVCRLLRTCHLYQLFCKLTGCLEMQFFLFLELKHLRSFCFLVLDCFPSPWRLIGFYFKSVPVSPGVTLHYFVFNDTRKSFPVPAVSSHPGTLCLRFPFCNVCSRLSWKSASPAWAWAHSQPCFSFCIWESLKILPRAWPWAAWCLHRLPQWLISTVMSGQPQLSSVLCIYIFLKWSVFILCVGILFVGIMCLFSMYVIHCLRKLEEGRLSPGTEVI